MSKLDKKLLNIRQENFCKEYIKDFNATKAYFRAGYSPKNPQSASVNSSRLLQNTNVRKYINKLLEERKKDTEILQARIQAELEKIAFGNFSDIATWNNNELIIKNEKNLTDNDRALISEMTYADTPAGTTKKIKLNDKLKALQELLKLCGAFQELEDDASHITINVIPASLKEEKEEDNEDE